jgi:hypothetical protein
LRLEITREQAERKKAKAADFMERMGQPDRAAEFADMSVDDYAEHKGIHLANPTRSKRRSTMANGVVTTKADLQDQIDQAIDVLEEAYQPESTREDVVEALSNALDILRGEKMRKKTRMMRTATRKTARIERTLREPPERSGLEPSFRPR